MTELAIEVDRVMGGLTPNARIEFELAVRELLLRTERKSPWDGVPKDAMGYPVGYFEQTVGALANEPFDEPAELPMQVREDW